MTAHNSSDGTLIWTRGMIKKMEDGLINIHGPFHGLDARLLHEKFDHDYHPFIIPPFIIPSFIP